MLIPAAGLAWAASAALGGVEHYAVDRAGHMRAVAGPGDLRHEDGDVLALVVRAPVAEAAQPVGLPVALLPTGLGAEGDTPTEVAFTPDGAKIVIAHRDSRNLTVMDAATRDVLATIPLSGSPNSVAVSADGVHAVTANIFEDTASIVDLVLARETDVVAAGDQPGIVRITPNGLTAVVGNTVSGSLSVIDIAAGSATGVIPGLQFTSSTSLNFESGVTTSRFTVFKFADNQTLLFPERFNSRVQFVDIVAGTVTPLVTAANPAALDVSPDGAVAVVAHASGTQLVSKIDVAAKTVTGTIASGVNLDSGTIAIKPDKTRAVVGVLNEVRVVNLVSNTISPSIPTTGVNDLVVTADGLHCLVVSFNGTLVSFATESAVANLNMLVSTNLGAHSPAGPRGVLAGSLFTEELLSVNTSGAAGFLEERVPTGPPPEGDKARHVALSADGSTAVAVNIFSDNVSIIDVAAQAVDAVLAVGDRPAESAITPDGAAAVVANLDSTFASVVDLGAPSVSSIPISTRASQVEISPDGSFAYLAVVASGDGAWRINLDTMAVQGPKVLTGNMGSVGFLYQQTSGMTLSHDGLTLVTCNSFDNNLSIIDTGLWAEVDRVPVGTFPVRAVFSPDDSLIYVSNANADTVSIVANAGPASGVVGTIPAGDQPFELSLSPDGETLYIGNFTAETISVATVVSAPGRPPRGAIAGLVALGEPVQGLHLDAAGETLYAAGGNWSVAIGPGPLITLNQTGTFAAIDAESLAVLEQVKTALPPAMLALRAADGLGLIPSPHGDGVAFIGAPCPGDIDGDGAVGITDFLALLGAWGPNPGHPADLDGDGTVGITDFLALLGGWGPCG
jgi:YVTN family beta-propeller protein